MMAHTDRHFRYLLRLLSARAMLYTEMLTTGALLYGDTERHIRFNAAEHPVGIQLGGSDPEALASCAGLAAERGYDEINLNIGCPSERVKSGRFGVCLMAEPDLVADCVSAMCAAATTTPVTVKTRTGVDEQDDYAHLHRFVATVSRAGCRTFIIHARKAWLQGLSPRQNRTVPPLQYDRVYRLKQDFPELEIVINGGINSLDETCAHLRHVDGAMLGRVLCHNTYLLVGVDKTVFGVNNSALSRMEILQRYLSYMEAELAQGESLYAMARHVIGLFHGQPGARAYRRHLTTRAVQKDAGVEVVREAAEFVRDQGSEATDEGLS